MQRFLAQSHASHAAQASLQQVFVANEGEHRHAVLGCKKWQLNSSNFNLFISIGSFGQFAQKRG